MILWQKDIYLSVSIFLSLGTFAKPLNGAAPDFQCQLKIFDKQTKRLKGICSGTYLTDRHFITAGHCFHILDTGASPSTTAHYYVSCFSTAPSKVQAVAVHPEFYKNSLNYFAVGETLNPEYGIAHMLEQNDMAIVLTDPVDLYHYPALPSRDQSLPQNFQEGSCRMLGFSPKYCGNFYDSQCYREGFSLLSMLSQRVDSFCDLSTGDGCSFAQNYNEFSSPEAPLMLQLKSQGQEKPKSAKGDSGGGLLCTEDSGTEVLTGIYVTSLEPQVVNIQNKMDFIEHFTSLTDFEFMDQAQTFNIDKNFQEVLLVRWQMNQFLGALNYLEFEAPFVQSVVSEHLPIMKSMVQWFSKRPDQARYLLAKENISKITPGYPSNQQWTVGGKKVNAILRLSLFQGQILEFNRHATIEEIITLLDKKRVL